MSNAVASLSGTLTSGIQEVSALLPIIGTEQCEKHVGSALEGGYIYAAATPLSIFGSLGIVKNGISILVASISIPKPALTYARSSPLDPPTRRWLGARILANAGFAPVGTVGHLIGIDKKRYKAETRLVEILEEKHIDAPENVTIQWKSRQWNINLIFCTLFAGALGIVPYAHLIPEASIPSPWIFPMIRALGSCLASISIQFLIQCRVVSLMKSRIIFMVMNRLHSNLMTIPDQSNINFQWDEALPAEECLTSLSQSVDIHRDTMKHVSHSLATTITRVRENLDAQYALHFPNPTRQHVLILFSWIILLISLPAAVVGYVGCFTLVSSSDVPNAPLIWLGLEAALAVLRILLWAWNPKFDEDTEVTVQLKLSKHPPLVTTDKDADLIRLTDGVFSLTPEWTFLEWISPYTGPLEQFDSPPNIVLYYTLTGLQAGTSLRDGTSLFLFMTVLDSSSRTAFSVRRGEDSCLVYHDAVVIQNLDTGEMQANLGSEINMNRPRPTNHILLVQQLSSYYDSLLNTLSNRRVSEALLAQKWSLVPQPTRSDNQLQTSLDPIEPFCRHSQLYLQRGYEHHLKAQLTKNWGQWVCDVMEAIRVNARDDCIYALADPTTEHAKWELAELDTRLLWEWTRRELALIQLSVEIEDLLYERMKTYVDKVTKERGDTGRRLWHWLSSQFAIGQKKRLEYERRQADRRMEEARQASVERARKEGRLYDDEKWFDNVTEQWGRGQKFIEVKWAEVMEQAAAIATEQWGAGQKFIEVKWAEVMEQAAFIATMGPQARERTIAPVLVDSDLELDHLVKRRRIPQVKDLSDDPEGRRRLAFVNRLQPRFTHWSSRRETEHGEMEDTIKRIREADFGQLDEAYHYPESSSQLAAAIHSKFVNLASLSETLERVFAARLSSAIVYNVAHCGTDVVRSVLQKSCVRSVMNLPEHLPIRIPADSPLLYIYPPSEAVRQSHERWWCEQTASSWTFYFSADCMDTHGRYVYNYGGTIAHIMIFIQSPARIGLRLLHLRKGEASVWIQEGEHKLLLIRPGDTAGDEVGLHRQGFELDPVFEQGRHELELVVEVSQSARYGLRDIQIEFDPP